MAAELWSHPPWPSMELLRLGCVVREIVSGGSGCASCPTQGCPAWESEARMPSGNVGRGPGVGSLSEVGLSPVAVRTPPVMHLLSHDVAWFALQEAPSSFCRKIKAPGPCS